MGRGQANVCKSLFGDGYQAMSYGCNVDLCGDWLIADL